MNKKLDLMNAVNDKRAALLDKAIKKLKAGEG
jgi:hypothetical protein